MHRGLSLLVLAVMVMASATCIVIVDLPCSQTMLTEQESKSTQLAMLNANQSFKDLLSLLSVALLALLSQFILVPAIRSTIYPFSIVRIYGARAISGQRNHLQQQVFLL